MLPPLTPTTARPLVPRPRLPVQRYVHAQCLAHWQQQLRAQKGFAAARRCDICKAPFARAHQLPSGPTHWRLLVRDVLRRVPWPAVLEASAGFGAGQHVQLRLRRHARKAA